MVFDRFKNKLAVIPLERDIAEGSGMGVCWWGLRVLSIRPDISTFKGKGKFKQAGFPFKPSEEEEEQRGSTL